MSFSSSSAATTKCRPGDGWGSHPVLRPLPLPVACDAHTFRNLIQKLTSTTDDTVEKLPATVPARYSARSPNCASSKDVSGPWRPAFKIHERRHSMQKLEINLGLTSLRGMVLSPRSQPLISPIACPVTPLGLNPLFSGQFSASRSNSPMSSLAVSEEEKAITLTVCG